MNKKTAVATSAYPYGSPVQRVSWGSIIAGTLIALTILALLNLLLLGLGFNSIDPASDQSPFAGVGVGSLIGLILINIVALFTGGAVAGRLAGAPRTFEALLHGLLVWALLTILSFILVTSAAGRIFNGVTSALGQGLSLAGQGLSAVAPEAARTVQDRLEQQGITLESVRQEAQQILNETTILESQEQDVSEEVQEAATNVQETAADVIQSPQQTRQEVNQLLSQLSSSGETLAEGAEREDLIAVLAKSTNLSQAEAEQTVDGWIASLQQSQTQIDDAQAALSEAAEQATDFLGSAALWTFISLLIGAAIAAVGGYVGSPDNAYEARKI